MIIIINLQWYVISENVNNGSRLFLNFEGYQSKTINNLNQFIFKLYKDAYIDYGIRATQQNKYYMRSTL